MRNLKFRAKRVDGQWVYGGIIFEKQKDNNFYYITDPMKNRERIWCHEIEQETVGQYIGITDINDQEIYEDDIIEIYNPFGEKIGIKVVEYSTWATGYEIPYDHYDYDFTTMGWAIDQGYSFKIIGNKHDNPELLEDK